MGYDWLMMFPIATQDVEDRQSTESRSNEPLGAVCELHVVPPSDVATMAGEAPSNPTAMHDVAVGHDTDRGLTPAGVVSADHVDPPSLVP